MKKTALILSLVLCATFFCACHKKSEPPFSPASPESEYARIYEDGQAFDFSTITTFTRKSTISLSGDVFADVKDVHNRPYFPTDEFAEYKYENLSGVIRSQRTIRHVKDFTAEYRPQYTAYFREIYADKALFYAKMGDDGVQRSTPVTPEKTYASREAYLADAKRCFDTDGQRVVPYDIAFFSSFTGQKEGKTYRITGIVDVEGHGEAFFEAFMANYTFKTWYEPVEDGRMYEYFVDPRTFAPSTSIRVEIVSDRNGLCSVTETIETTACRRPILAVSGQRIRLTCTTTYSTAAFEEAIVTPPIAA